MDAGIFKMKLRTPKPILLYCFFLTLLTASCSNTDKKSVDQDPQLFYLDGTVCDIDSFQGKYVLVDIWGLGCAPCIEAIPDLISLQDRYKEDLVILAINDLIYFDKLNKFVGDSKINYKIVVPKDSEQLMPVYYKFSNGSFNGFPYYALLDRRGKLMERGISYGFAEYLILMEKNKN